MGIISKLLNEANYEELSACLAHELNDRSTLLDEPRERTNTYSFHVVSDPSDPGLMVFTYHEDQFCETPPSQTTQIRFADLASASAITHLNPTLKEFLAYADYLGE